MTKTNFTLGYFTKNISWSTERNFIVVDDVITFLIWKVILAWDPKLNNTLTAEKKRSKLLHSFTTTD